MRPGYPPGPPDSFFGLAHSKALRRDMMGYGAELQRTYGDVVHFRLGPISAYQFTHPDHIAEVLIRQAKKFRKSARFKHVFGRFEGDGLLVSDGPVWARHRHFVQPAFTAARMLSYRETIQTDCRPACGCVERPGFDRTVRGDDGVHVTRILHANLVLDSFGR